MLNKRYHQSLKAIKKEQLKLKDYIEDISHQLKTPITSIRLQTELLLEENSTDECVKKYAEKLIKDVWNLRLESLLYEYVRGEGNEEKFVNECNLEAFKEWEKVQKNAQNNTPSEEKE